MAFKLTTKRIVEWPVTMAMPVNGGTTQDQQCTATFEIIPQDEYNALMKNDIDFLNRVVVGFGDDIQDEDGNGLLCTTGNKKALFASAGFVRLGFINAYHEASAGIEAKNSKGPRATGRTAPKSRKRK
jgi:hypothetical protein